MSFMLTTQQVRDGTKTVTRRLGWWFLKPGDMVMACVKCQGLRKGEKVEHIRPIRIVSTEPVWACEISADDCRREGFPDLTPREFVGMFCAEMKCGPYTKVNRIKFEYVQTPEVSQ